MSPVEGPVGTHGFLGLFCCLCHADIDCNLTIGHDTEQPDSKHTMILIPSSSARLGHTQQEGHNAEMYQRYIQWLLPARRCSKVFKVLPLLQPEASLTFALSVSFLRQRLDREWCVPSQHEATQGVIGSPGPRDSSREPAVPPNTSGVIDVSAPGQTRG